MLDMISGMLQNLPSIIQAVIAFGFLILVHELGHYAAAKLLGIRVERLSLGFGRRLIGFSWRGTEYQVAIIPYGGYVKLYGDIEDQEKTTENIAAAQSDPSGFLNQPPWKRAVVYFSGAAVNFLVAIPLLTFSYLNGIRMIEPVIGTQLEPNSPLFAAGVRPGDRVLSVNGRRVQDFLDIREQLMFAQSQRPVHILVERDGETKLLSVTEPGEMVTMTSPPPFVTTTIGEIARRSAAQRAGLDPGDTIVAIDGEPAATWPAVQDAITKNPGKTLELTIERETKPGHVERMPVLVTPEARTVWDIGAEPEPSLVIGGVVPGGPAHRAGFEPHDHVLAIDGQPVRTFGEMREIVRRSAGQRLVFTILRGEKELELGVVPEEQNNGQQGAAVIGVYGGQTPAMIPAPDSPASRAGVEPGDIPVQYGDAKIRTWEDLAAAVEKYQDKPTTLVVRRGATRVHLSIAAEKRDVGELGVTPRLLSRFVRFGLLESLRRGTVETVGFARKTYVTVYMLVTGKVRPRYLAGPVGIMYLVTHEARQGLSKLCWFVAFITVNLAILNLLPLPILDGGHLLFLAVEKVSGRRLPLSVQVVAQYVGLFLLLALMILATSNDLRNFVFGPK